MTQMTHRFRPLWIVLGAPLWFLTEALHGVTSGTRSPLELATHAVFALASAALLLDVAARWRAHGLYGLLSLAGLYGLAAVIAVEPSGSAATLPHLLVVQGLGAQTLVGLAALGLTLALLGNRAWGLGIVGAALTGAGWVLWSPPTLASSTLLLAVAGAAALTIVSWLAARAESAVQSGSFVLTPVGRATAVVVLAAVAVYRLIGGLLDPIALTIAALLLAFTLILLYFQRSKRAVSLLERRLPPAPLRLHLLIVPVAFVAGSAAGIALSTHADVRAALDVAVTAFGLAWLPAISFAIGARTLLRQVRAQQL